MNTPTGLSTRTWPRRNCGVTGRPTTARLTSITPRRTRLAVVRRPRHACALRRTTGDATGTSSYLGPTIVAMKGRPTRIKFTNNLPDRILMVATSSSRRTRRHGSRGRAYDPLTNTTGTYTQNRATLHLHGGFTPWISDGTPHQWITPAGETTPTPEGVSMQHVPDMPDPGPGVDDVLLHEPAERPADVLPRPRLRHHPPQRLRGRGCRLPAQDPVEQKLVTAGTIPGRRYPPTGGPFRWSSRTRRSCGRVQQPLRTGTWARSDLELGHTEPPGNLWFPHVYMPNQNPCDLTGANADGPVGLRAPGSGRRSPA